MSLYMAVVYGYLYLLFTTFPRVFEGQYGFSIDSVGLTYLGTGVGAFLGVVLCGALSDRLVKRLTARNGGNPKPEYRLPASMIIFKPFVSLSGLLKDSLAFLECLRRAETMRKIVNLEKLQIAP